MFRWSGQASEAEDICKALNNEDVNTTDKDMKECRSMVTEMCHVENQRRLRSVMEGKTKYRRI
jgi:hypothetical protein